MEKSTKLFSVSVFGSARVADEMPVYQQAVRLGELLARENINLITGGGPGIMEAAAKGHSQVSNDSQALGLTIELPFENDSNEYNQAVEHFSHFSSRLERFMSLSQAVVVMDGGIGTGLELFFTWQLMQAQHIENMPIILMGEQWMYLRQWARRYLLAKDYMNHSDLDMLYTARNTEQAMNIIQRAHRCFLEGKPYQHDAVVHE